MKQEIFVAGHPKPKGSWVAIKGGKFRHASKYTARWCKFLGDELKRRWQHKQLIEGPVKLRLWFTLPPPRSVDRKYPTGRYDGDVDKLCRAVLDEMSGVVYVDDVQVVEVHATKRYGSKVGVKIKYELV